ncbi:trypsin-like serine protease [Vibrio sp. L3-7]|uniref:trypsin-like serine protease n=1 Tax=Vibrio sp. L3-7 TaxID=2912253 RepID=UPI001F011B85|nr:trypsin-like serine protease [Vibrio sp. L3-7]MCF7506085.1 trypsin-like serine protease [Vibrio sp. L3-7]
MKKTPLALTLSLLSSPVFAITNGTNVDWQNDFDDMVKNNCTGMVVGGNQILTAAHCTELTGITFANGVAMDASRRDDHPNYLYSSSGSQYDVSVWTLPQIPETQNIHYFANLNTQTVAIGDSIKAYGFGGYNPLAYAELIIGKLSSLASTGFESTAISGDLIQGDSGGIWMHRNNVVAINRSFSHSRLSYGTDLHYAKDFLLEQFNGWHYPTILKETGTQTIKVQSLHQNSVVDAAYVVGDVTITGGTCQTLPAIDAFDTCTYELDVSGSGQLHLTTNEVIDINPVTPTPVPPPTTTPSSGGSGGSLGVFSLLGLAVFGRLKKR